MADELPKEVARDILQIGPIEIEVVQLDNGQRLVTAEGLAKFMDWLAAGSAESTGNKEDEAG